jgi:hypothetical protein
MMLVSIGTAKAEEAKVVKKAGASIAVVANPTSLMSPSAGALLKTKSVWCPITHKMITVRK